MDGLAVSYTSWLVAVLSIVPIVFVLAGLLICSCILVRRRRAHDKDTDLAWKPLSLRWPTLLLLLGLIGSFIILLESASLGFGGQTMTGNTAAAHRVHVFVVTTDVVDNSVFLGTGQPLPKPTTQKSSIKPNLQTWRDSCATRDCTSHTTSGGWLKSSYIETVTRSTWTATGGWLTTIGPQHTLTPTSTGAQVATITASATATGFLQPGSARLSWETQYFIGTFLPTLLASIFAIPWRILDHDTRTLEPFAYLARPGGGTAAQTLLLHYDGVSGLSHVLQHAFSPDHLVVTLSTLLKYCAALLGPLASESVRMGLEGDCLQDYRLSCTGTLQASSKVIYTTQALLCLMGCVVFAYCLLLGVTWRRRAFGVTSDPRSILGFASLSLNPFLTAVLRRKELEKEEGTFCAERARKILASAQFQFGYVAVPPAEQEYAILVSLESEHDEPCAVNNVNKQEVQSSAEDIPAATPPPRRKHVLSALVIKMAVFAFFLAALIFMILWYLYYPNTETGFERFMDSEAFGVRFLFTLFGVLIGFGWGSIYSEMAAMTPLWNMSHHSTPAASSIALPLSPSPYVGLVTYLHQKQILLALLAFTVIVSDFLPIFLANVPFSHAITVTTFKASTYLCLGVLCFMLVVLCLLAVPMLFGPPRASTELDTLGGVLHLVARSSDFQRQLQGLTHGAGREVQKRLAALDASYVILNLVACAILRCFRKTLLPLAGNVMCTALGVGRRESLLGFDSLGFLPVPLILYVYHERMRWSPFLKMEF